MPSNHLILCHLLLLLPSIFPSIRVFSNESVLRIRWPKYWSFTFSVRPSNEYSVPISFTMYLLDLLAVQGTLKSLLQHHSSKASTLRHSAFFIAQLSHLYMTTRKTIVLTRWTFVGKVMSLLFNMLSKLVIIFLPGSKRLLISWLQSPFAVIWGPPKWKCLTVSIVSPCICHEVMGPDAMILVFWTKELRSWTPYCKFRFKLKKVGKTTRPLRYDQCAYDVPDKGNRKMAWVGECDSVSGIPKLVEGHLGNHSSWWQGLGLHWWKPTPQLPAISGPG